VTGEVEVTKAGEVVRRLGPGTSFGEIALLRDVPRTASVICLTDVSLLSIRRDDFLEIVTGHPTRLQAATDLADGWNSSTT
jgi:CRP-like cAMP-binding protein